MNKDWNPTDEDIWLSNAVRELFGFPLIYYRSLADYIKTPRQWNTNYKPIGLIDWGKDEDSSTFLTNIRQVTGEVKPQPISEHRVCPYCGKKGVVGNNLYDLWEDNGNPHVCPVIQKLEGIIDK